MNATYTKSELIAKLTELGIQFKKKAPRSELLALLAEVQSKKAKAPAPAEKVKRPAMKEVIWRLFDENPQLVITLAELIAKHLPGAKESSVLTWCGNGGLGSKKYGYAPDGKTVKPMLVQFDRKSGELRRVH